MLSDILIWFFMNTKERAETSKMIIDALQSRYSVKQFDATKKISEEDWSVIEDALVLTPSSFGLEPWKFIVIKDATLKEQLKAASWHQPQITDCSHLVVFCAKNTIDAEYIGVVIDNMATVRRVSADDMKGYKDRLLGYFANESLNQPHYTANQTFIALGSILTVASLLKIDACPIGGFEPNEYSRILGDVIPAGYTPSVVCPFGYRMEGDKYASIKKARQPKQNLIITK
jgi:nitroreductase